MESSIFKFLIMVLFLAIMLQNYDHWGNVICTGKDSLIRDGHKSFPSGHTSCKILSFLHSQYSLSFLISSYWKFRMLCSVVCWSKFFGTVLSWKNQSVWSSGPCSKTVCHFPSTPYGVSCSCFSSRWLSAPLARCICWWSFRYVSIFIRSAQSFRLGGSFNPFT